VRLNATCPPGSAEETYVQFRVRAVAEKFVTTSSVENVFVSTTTGSVASVTVAAGFARKGSMNEPSEFAWSFTTPYA
jgi:hypothetical protein